MHVLWCEFFFCLFFRTMSQGAIVMLIHGLVPCFALYIHVGANNRALKQKHGRGKPPKIPVSHWFEPS